MAFCSPSEKWYFVLLQRNGILFFFREMAFYSSSEKWHFVLPKRNGILFFFREMAFCSPSEKWYFVLLKRNKMIEKMINIIERNYLKTIPFWHTIEMKLKFLKKKKTTQKNLNLISQCWRFPNVSVYNNPRRVDMQLINHILVHKMICFVSFFLECLCKFCKFLNRKNPDLRLNASKCPQNVLEV